MGCGASAKDDRATGDRDTGNSGKKRDKGATKKDVQGPTIQRNLIADNPGKIAEFYNIEKKKLGEGSYGSVTKAVHKTTNAVRAVKHIPKAQMKNRDRFLQEIVIMRKMDHPNICKLFESFEDNRNLYLVMELCLGGELFDRIIDAGHFSEAQAAVCMQHMFRAIHYMHENLICHRDLKPENFLFTTKDKIDSETNTLKVIDFGLACKFAKDQVLTTKAGTPYYVAPQVLSGKYDQASDLWSLGVIMFVLLVGYPPFHGENDADVLAKVRLGNYSFAHNDWKNVSEDAKNLIRMLLKMSPKERYTAKQALDHVWIDQKAPKACNVKLESKLVDNLRGFRSQNKLKKAALHVIASQLQESQIKALQQTFMALDGNGDGMLTANELKEGMEKAGLKDIPKDLQQLLKDVDSDGSGLIDYTEFLAATLDSSKYLKEDICWQAFQVFDLNNDGKISKEELRKVLNDGDVQSIAAKDLAELMEELDKDGDGEIDFVEFMQMMRG